MRPRRPPYIKNQYYHFYNRGANGSRIFREDDNYVYVLTKCKEYCNRLSISMIAYCLMPNHYHFLVRQDGDLNAGLLPQRIFNAYTKAFNKRYQRSGTLFEGPYEVIMVEQDNHLLHLCRYIHANPVKGNIVENLEDWLYSNYLEWVGLRDGTLVDKGFINQQFDSVELYREFLLNYLHNPSAEVDMDGAYQEYF